MRERFIIATIVAFAALGLRPVSAQQPADGSSRLAARGAQADLSRRSTDLSAEAGGAKAEGAKADVVGRLALGVVSQGGIFGDDNPREQSAIAPTIGGQVWKRFSASKALVFEGTLQPKGLQNPHFDEQVNVLSLQLGPELGRRLYVRPSGGFAMRLWSGSRSNGGIDFAPALGVAIGRRQAVGARYEASPEFFMRTTGPTDGALTWMIGVQVPIGRSSAR